MDETSAELTELQALLDRSHASASTHLRDIITPPRMLSADDLCRVLVGMKVLAVATVTASGEPRISALDGHFLHSSWTFSTSGTAVKARHVAARPAVSVAHIDGEQMAVFAHGRAEALDLTSGYGAEVLAHWTAHYGSSPLSWGPSIRMYRLAAHWMVGYAADRTALLRG
jgi:hypothetical protein